MPYLSLSLSPSLSSCLQNQAWQTQEALVDLGEKISPHLQCRDWGVLLHGWAHPFISRETRSNHSGAEVTGPVDGRLDYGRKDWRKGKQRPSQRSSRRLEVVRQVHQVDFEAYKVGKMFCFVIIALKIRMLFWSHRGRLEATKSAFVKPFT
ncbi:unnamed protein product [Protopolystoma xenopodis]|uniref:Uncharacterized protein n=1 Tax=Protopolystoma xenopodis TaxID=117903 RepID=A0A448XH84_9PLAT|nr:unnamed protein product [Protopolystoma xenopodis]